MSNLADAMYGCDYLPDAAQEELQSLLLGVKKVAGDDGFWKQSAEATYMEWAKLLYLDGKEPQVILEMLEDLYYAAAECYGQ